MMFENFTFSAALIVDLIAVAFLIFFVWNGKRRGLIKTVTGILVLLLAFGGAGALSRMTAPFLSETFVEPKLTQALLPQQTPSQSPDAQPTEDSISSVLLDLGLPVDTVSDALEEFRKDAEISVEHAVVSLSHSLSEKITHLISFVAYFLILLILLSLLARLLNALAKLPVLNEINKFGGALVGFLLGYLALMLAVSILTSLNLWLTADLVEQTKLLKFISGTNPLAILLGRV